MTDEDFKKRLKVLEARLAELKETKPVMWVDVAGLFVGCVLGLLSAWGFVAWIGWVV